MLALIDRNFQGLGKCASTTAGQQALSFMLLSFPFVLSISNFLRYPGEVLFMVSAYLVFMHLRELFTDAGKYVIHFGNKPEEAAEQVRLNTV